MGVTLLQGDCLEVLKTLPDASVQTCVTSPPYFGLRNYGVDGQIGLEETPEAYVAKLVAVFREVRRVLKDDGTLWLNLGDSYVHSQPGRNRNGRGGQIVRGDMYRSKNNDGNSDVGKALHDAGYKDKDLLGIPWMVAFALRADGWYLRSDIIWSKPNPMPESVTDRPTKSHEYIFLLAKSAKYYYDAEAISEKSKDPESYAGRRKRTMTAAYVSVTGHKNTTGVHEGKTYPTRNKRSVWTVTTKPYRGAHFATFPPDLIEPCILAGSRVGDVVLDPFNGSGTTGAVAIGNGRDYTGIELNPEYIALTEKRLAGVNLPLIERT